MPEIQVKDKLITLEELGTAYNNSVKKSGDTMTGTLSVNRTSDEGEADVEAKSAAGTIYLYSSGSNTGTRGIYSRNASNVSVGVIEVSQDNHTIFYGKATENVAKSGDTMTGPLNIRGDLYSYDIDFKPTVGAGIGGFVDFTYNGEDIDYTSRIIENQRGVLNVNGIPFDKANPVIGVPYGGTGATTKIGACENIGAVNSDTLDRSFTSGSVNDAPLGATAYAGDNSNVTQKPYSNWFTVFTFNGGGGNYLQQMALPWFNNNSIAFRIKAYSGSWSSWRYIATQATEPTT